MYDTTQSRFRLKNLARLTMAVYGSGRSAPMLPGTQGSFMLCLAEISVRLQSVIDATLASDPLVAADLDYSVKTWMAGHPSLACRPWGVSTTRNTIRIAGWRDRPPESPDRKVYVGMREIAIEAGETMTLSGKFIALRRTTNRLRGKSQARDAADGSDDPRGAYSTWLRERLIDLSPFATIEEFQIDRFSKRRVLRKIDHSKTSTKVATQIIPVVDATVHLMVKNPAGVELWLKRGVGSQKAFGYGAFFPTLDLRERS